MRRTKVMADSAEVGPVHSSSPTPPTTSELVANVPPATATTAALVSPSTTEIHANVSDDIYNTIVRIVVHEAEFDFELPFKIKGNTMASGTGFFIDEKGHILTCSHVVQTASHVYIEIPKEGKRQYKAHVLGICPHFDLAVIRVENYTNTQHCQLHHATDSNIKSGDETYALGFPLGQDNLKVTKGIISGQQHNMYQIDTPINPGNSGGPLVKNGLVIGVNGAGVIFANNIGYAVPISRYFAIRDLLYMPKRLIHYPEVFGFDFQRTNQDFVDFMGYSCGTPAAARHQSAKLSRKTPRASSVTTTTTTTTTTGTGTRRRSNIRTGSVSGSTKSTTPPPHTTTTTTMCDGGVYIKRTFKQSPIDRVRMRKGDILCSINGIGIDQFGEFGQRWMNQKMSMSNMLCSLPLNQRVEVKFWSAKQKAMVHKNFVLKEYKMPVRKVYPVFEPEAVDYEVVGGMVVMALRMNHILYSSYKSIGKYRKIENRHEPRLVISSVLMGSTLATSKMIKSSEVIEEVNGKAVHTLGEFRTMLCKPLAKQGKKYIKISTENNNLAILSIETILKEEPHLQSIYKYAASPLLEKLKKHAHA